MVRKLPSIKQRRIIQAKIQGKRNKDIAEIEYPNASEKSKGVVISKELAKPHVAQFLEQSKLIALKESNITWKRVTDVISNALNAEKQNQFTGEIMDDHTTRLSAAKQARDLLDLPKDTKDEELQKALSKLPDNLSDIELQRIVFKQNKDN